MIHGLNVSNTFAIEYTKEVKEYLEKKYKQQIAILSDCLSLKVGKITFERYSTISAGELTTDLGVKDFNYLKEIIEGKNMKDEKIFIDISLIKDVDDKKIKELQRAFTLGYEDIIKNSVIEIDGTVTTCHLKNFPKNSKGTHFNSDNWNDMLRHFKVYCPEKFELNKSYIVREFASLQKEYGLVDDISELKINNTNKFPASRKELCGQRFVKTNEDRKRSEINGMAVFPEECYEVESEIQLAKYDDVDIFSGEGAGVARPKPKVIINKVGDRYFRNKDEVIISNMVGDYDINELQVNERRYIAAMELNETYDNLEEKSKRVQDLIVNELDSEEAIADKEWVYLFGASGSGKTTEAVKYAENKKLQYVKQAGFGQLTGDDLLGYKSITDGTYFRSLLRDAVEHGYIFIFDEMDACNPNTLLVLNELKGKSMQFPDKLIDIHENFRLIATGNTLGFSEDYNGRSKMDKATIARFSIIEYNLSRLDLGERYGGKHVATIQDIGTKDPREIQREIRQLKQKENNHVTTENIYQ